MCCWRQWAANRRDGGRGQPCNALHRCRVERLLHWWARRARARRQLRVRAATVAGRAQLSCTCWALGAWVVATLLSLRASCDNLAGRLGAGSCAGLSCPPPEAHSEHERERELAGEVVRRSAALAAAAASARRARAANTLLLAELEAERAQGQERRERQESERQGENQGGQGPCPEPGGVLWAQLGEALEVQGSLRYALRSAEAEGVRARIARGAADRRSLALRQRLEEARASYICAVHALDARVASYAQRGLQAQLAAQRLQRALEEAEFHVRLSDAEIQKWR